VTRFGLILGSFFAIAACGGEPSSPPTGGADASVSMDGSGIVEVESGPWEDQCIAWHRADCMKFESCFQQSHPDCRKNNETLRSECRASAMEDGCARPDPAAFERCTERIETQTCEEYCDTMFCFSFCFYSCLP
jgi:hypothetical protein